MPANRFLRKYIRSCVDTANPLYLSHVPTFACSDVLTSNWHVPDTTASYKYSYKYKYISTLISMLGCMQ